MVSFEVCVCLWFVRLKQILIGNVVIFFVAFLGFVYVHLGYFQSQINIDCK